MSGGGSGAANITSVNNIANIGNMTSGGGLASSFDGTTTGKSCSSVGTASARTIDTNGYAGRQYSGVGHSIDHVTVYSDSGGYGNSGGTATLNIFAGASDLGPGGGTLLGTVSVSCASVTPQTITSSDNNTKYNFIWVQNTGCSGGGAVCFTQHQYFGQ